MKPCEICGTGSANQVTADCGHATCLCSSCRRECLSATSQCEACARAGKPRKRKRVVEVQPEKQEQTVTKKQEGIVVNTTLPEPLGSVELKPSTAGYFVFSREAGRCEVQPSKREALVAAVGDDAEAIAQIPQAAHDRTTFGRVLGDVTGRLRGKPAVLKKKHTSDEKIVHALVNVETKEELAELTWEEGVGASCTDGDGGLPVVKEVLEQFATNRGMVTGDDWAALLRTRLKELDGFKARRDGRVYWTPDSALPVLTALKRAAAPAGLDIIIAQNAEADLGRRVAADGLADQISELADRTGSTSVLLAGVAEITARAARLGIELCTEDQAQLQALVAKAESKRGAKPGRKPRAVVPEPTAAPAPVSALAPIPAAPAAPAAPLPVPPPPAAAMPPPAPVAAPVAPPPPPPDAVVERGGVQYELDYVGEAAGGMHAYTVRKVEAPVFDWEPYGTGHLCGYAGRVFSTVQL